MTRVALFDVTLALAGPAAGIGSRGGDLGDGEALAARTSHYWVVGDATPAPNADVVANPQLLDLLAYRYAC